MEINFELYKSFVCIYRTGSISAAAINRYMTQPALSQHLQTLENIIGETLFIRTPRKMIPTERGKSLYASIISSIEQLENVSSSLFQSKNENINIRIGSPVEFFSTVLLDKIKAITNPFSLEFAYLNELADKLQEDKLDIIIATKHLERTGLVFQPFYVESFVFVANKSIKVDSEDTMVWMQNQNWLSLSPELPIIRRFWRDNFKERPILKKVNVLPDLRAILEGVNIGLGVSIIPSYLIKNNCESLYLPFPHLFSKNQLYLCYKTKYENYYATKVIKDIIKEINNI